MNHVLRLALLTAAWIVLWRDVSWANLASGLLVSGLVLWAFPSRGPRAQVRRMRPLAMVRFLLTAGWSIVRANLVVAWEVVTPSNRINEAIVAVPVHTSSPAVVTLISHAISLAPGTIVIDITDDDDATHPPVLHIHALHFRSVEDCEREVRELERLALAAFPDTRLPRSEATT